MKKIFLFLFIASLSFAQQEQQKSLAELQCQISGLQSAEYKVLNLENDTQKLKSKKNPGLAILFSMLLPGMGELYAGDYSGGKYFTIADGVLWGVFAGFQSYGNWKEDNYKSFLQSKAGANLDGKDNDYFTNVGIYISVDEYNKEQELNREFSSAYYKSSYYWKWQSESDRKEYRNMWSSSENAYTNVRFVVGALVLNRLLSAINAVRLVSAYNKNLESDSQLSYYFSYRPATSLPSSINLNLVKPF
jgi:hypothetical protein